VFPFPVAIIFSHLPKRHLRTEVGITLFVDSDLHLLMHFGTVCTWICIFLRIGVFSSPVRDVLSKGVALASLPHLLLSQSSNPAYVSAPACAAIVRRRKLDSGRPARLRAARQCVVKSKRALESDFVSCSIGSTW